MADKKKPVAALGVAAAKEVKATAKAEEKAPVKAEAKEVAKKTEEKAVEAKKEVKEVKKAATKTAATAKKAASKTTATAKKAAAKTVKTAEKAVKKVTTAKKVSEEVVIQFAGKAYTTETLIKSAKDIWVYDLGNKEADIKSVEVYAKPEESIAYYVINGDVTGSFYI